MLRNLLFAILLLLCFPSIAGTGKYRAMWRDNPATTMVIGWNQVSGSGAILYYDTVDHGTNKAAYAFQRGVDRSITYKGMNNRFSRLTGLSANTVYYFVIGDSDSTSVRMKFRTATADNSAFTLISGGDSRNNTTVRIAANKMVAKLRPTAVMFGGDMTDTDSDAQWFEWMDHWQYTTTSDGRLIPILATRGNHEASNASIANLFDTATGVYYALAFGNNVLRTYTLNSEDVEGGTQGTWLQNDLAAAGAVQWKMAQYHKPMRPHVSSKSEGTAEYAAWAQTFYDYKMNLVVECDSHCVKTTWPLRPSSAAGNVEGFVRDDANGTIFVGEGTWGAPLRTADDNKSWTRESGSFNQFKWLYVSPTELTFKTIKYENVDSVAEVNEANPYAPPTGLQTWGSTVTLTASSGNAAPVANFSFTTNQLQASFSDASSDSDGSIVQRSWSFGDGGSSSGINPSYSYASAGSYQVSLTVTDDDGASATTSKTVTVGSGWTPLTSDNFEAGYGSYVDGGTDCIRSSNNFSWAHQGTYCLLIRDDTSTSNFTSKSINLTGKSQVRINFWFIANSMEAGENFLVEFYDGSTWETVGDFVSGSSFTNGSFYQPEIILSSIDYSFNNANKLRFRCDASSDTDYVYIDEVVLTTQ